MRMLCTFGTAITCAAVLGGCSDPAEPARLVEVNWTLSRSTVQQHDSVTARLVIVNPTDQAVALTSGCGTIGTPVVRKNGLQVPFDGAHLGCFTVMTEITIDPRESVVQEYVLRAQTADGGAIPPGEYTIDYDFHINALLGATRPVTLSVRP